MINSKFFFSEFIFIFEFFSRIFSLNTFYDIKKLLNIRWHKLIAFHKLSNPQLNQYDNKYCYPAELYK